MAILDILEAPHPVLAAKARPVREDEFGPELARRLEDMTETMYAAPGVGLAAPQVGDGRCMLVADPGNEDDEGNVKKGPELVRMVNPVITERSRERIVWEESCLSVPELYVDVKRHLRIVVDYRDAAGATHQKAFEGFAAVVIQHELDHLIGTTLLDRASRLKRGRYISRRKKAGKPS